jgi:hypothetical protein
MNDDENVLQEFVTFGIDFGVENGDRVWVEDVYERYITKCPIASLEILNQDNRFVTYSENIFPTIGFTDTEAIIIRKKYWDALNVSFSGLTMIPVNVEVKRDTVYYILWFNEFVDCIDWVCSEYDPWPKNHVLQPWQNPKGRWFLDAVLDSKKLPSNLDVFRLKDWGGPFNFVVNEKVAESLLLINNAEKFIDFRELKIT